MFDHQLVLIIKLRVRIHLKLYLFVRQSDNPTPEMHCIVCKNSDDFF